MVEIQLATTHAGADTDDLSSVEETASMLDEKLYHMVYVAQETFSHAQQVIKVCQQSIKVGQQARTEIATLRDVCTGVIQKYRGCRDAYAALHERHKEAAAELERLKNQIFEERAPSEVRDLEDIKQIEAKLALFENERQELLQNGETLVGTEHQMGNLEEKPDLYKTGENTDVVGHPLPVLNALSSKREREQVNSQGEESSKKSRKRKAKQQK